MASGEACGEVDVGGGWTDIDNPESNTKDGNGAPEGIDLDDMMMANVVEE